MITVFQMIQVMHDETTSKRLQVGRVSTTETSESSDDKRVNAAIPPRDKLALCVMKKSISTSATEKLLELFPKLEWEGFQSTEARELLGTLRIITDHNVLKCAATYMLAYYDGR